MLSAFLLQPLSLLLSLGWQPFGIGAAPHTPTMCVYICVRIYIEIYTQINTLKGQFPASWPCCQLRRLPSRWGSVLLRSSCAPRPWVRVGPGLQAAAPGQKATGRRFLGDQEWCQAAAGRNIGESLRGRGGMEPALQRCVLGCCGCLGPGPAPVTAMLWEHENQAGTGGTGGTGASPAPWNSLHKLGCWCVSSFSPGYTQSLWQGHRISWGAMGCRRVLRGAMGCFGVLDAQAGLRQADPAQTQPCCPVGISPTSNHGVELEIRRNCKTGPSLVPESCNTMASLNNTQTLTEARVCHL